MFEDTISIEGIDVDCVVGVYPDERGRRQPLRVDLALTLDTDEAARRSSLRRTVDYGAVAGEVAFLLESGEFRMIETAAHALARYLLAPPVPPEGRAQIERVRVRLSKPAALRGLATPSVAIERPRGWARFAVEEKDFGTVDVLHETREAGIYRLHVHPGRSIPMHVHRVMRESEMVLTDGLLLQGKAVAAGTVHRWPHDAPHEYTNPTERVATILCVDAPRFIPSDEIVVDADPADVRPERPWLDRSPRS